MEIGDENLSSIINIFFPRTADRSLNPSRRSRLIFRVSIVSATHQAGPVGEAESFRAGSSSEHGGDPPLVDAEVEEEADLLHRPPQAAEE